MAAALHLSVPSTAPPDTSNPSTILKSSNLSLATPPSILLQRVTDPKSLKQIHAQIIKSRSPQTLQVQTKFISLYSLFNQMDFAELCFQRIPFKLQFAYNAMIRGYSTHGFFEKALFLYSKMLYSDSTPPDKFTFPFILKSCAALSAPSEAREAHGRIIKTGLASDVHISTSLVDFYMKLGEVGIARQVFDKIPLKNTVCWNALIAGYAYNELDVEAVDAFKWMIELGFEPNSSTMASALPAVGRLGDLEEGKLMHKLIIEKGIEIKEPVINSLIAMYGKCGEMETARQLFDEMLERTAVSWTVMISTYAQNGKFAKALELFICMQAYGVKPTAVTVASILPACADMMHIKLGMKVHGYSMKSGFDLDIIMSTALVDMYAKCGCIAEARRVFDGMPERNIVSWNAMINAFGLHGQVMDALAWFSMMQLNGIKPNGSTFVSLISACSHAGMVAEGLECFKSMSRDYDLVPETKHYACVVDLLGRAGRLKEAYELIKTMPLEPDDSAWGALLGACRIHKDVELGKMAALKALELQPREPGYYVLLTNIYAGSRRWTDAQKLREVMKEKKILKEAGCSSIEDGGIVHSFVVGDSKHPEWKKIYKKMEEIEEKLKEEGYVPDTSLVLHEESEKSERLAMHSERIALAFGLLKIPDGIPIKITKNLRVCGDCHSAFKLASRIYKREIVLRDLRRFHTFESGNCSCKDYW